jgi:DNA-binding Lrp family transcriptional regulator
MKAYMALSCKVGYFNRVIDELIKMGLTKKDVFLLFGPLDIIVQFNSILSLDEFIRNWFDPIRKITPEEPMLKKTETYIVITEGKRFDEEPYAFVFLTCQPRDLEQVRLQLETVPQVLAADTVFGPYDLICAVKAANKNELQQLVANIEQIPGIRDTVTEIVASMY